MAAINPNMIPMMESTSLAEILLDALLAPVMPMDEVTDGTPTLMSNETDVDLYVMLSLSNDAASVQHFTP